MLAIAQQRCYAVPKSLGTPEVRFYEFDALKADDFPEVEKLGKAELVLSTLVLEHLPLDVFFRTLRRFVKKGGLAVITNMHAQMGRISQAGFVDPATDTKIRGQSYVYEIEEVLAEARKCGFILVEGVMERGIRDEDMRVGTVGERGQKWVGVLCWFGMVLRFVGEEE